VLVRNPQAPRHDGAVPLSFEEDLRMQRGAAQNLLAQSPDGLYLFNFPCRLAEKRNIMHTDPTAFTRTTALLHEMGSLKTLAGKDKRYTYYRDLPIYVEANRPRRYHQTVPFVIRGRDVRGATVALRFRQVAERNPHADGAFRQHPIVRRDLLSYYLNDRRIPGAELRTTRMPAGRVPSGFLLKAHETVEIELSGRELRDGENTLAFELLRAPHERDPYVYVYDLEAEVRFG
jgi:hypothetical protein